MSDDNQTTETEVTGEENKAKVKPRGGKGRSEAAQRRSKKRRRNGMILEYGEANPEEQELMDMLIAPLEEDPENDTLILEFGSEPIKLIGEIADDLIEMQKSWASAANALADPIDKMQNKMSSLNISDAADAMKDMAEDGVRATGNLIVRMTSSIKNAVSGRNKKKEDYDEIMKQLDETLPSLLGDLNDMVDDLERSLEDLEYVGDQSKLLGKAWVDAVSQMSVYIGAGKELLVRYDYQDDTEESPGIIQEARLMYDEDASLEAEEYLQTIVSNRDYLHQQLVQMETQMTVAKNSSEQLRKIKEDIKIQRQQINNFLTNGIGMWKGMIATTSTASTSLKVSTQLKKAAEFGTDIMKMGMDATEHSSKLIQESRKNGVIDHRSVIEAAQRTKKLLEAEATNRMNHRKLLEAQSKGLEAALADLSETAAKVSEGRLIEAGGKSRKSKNNASSNDNDKDALSDNFSDAIAIKGKDGQMSQLEIAQAKIKQKKLNAASPKK